MWSLFQRIPQWTTKTWSRNFEAVAGLGNDTRIAAQGSGTEKVAVDVAGLSEQLIFEMVMLQIADRVRHTLFTGQEGCFPKRLAVPLDSDLAGDFRRRRSNDDFRPE